MNITLPNYRRAPLNLLIFALLSAVLLSSCLKIEKEYFPLTGVKLKMIEGLTNDQRSLYLYFETDETYPCVNYFIRYQYQNNQGNLNIHLRDVEKNNTCFGGEGPATAEINAGSYLIGVYQVELKVGQAQNSGTMVVSGSRYILHFPDPNHLTVLTDTLNRIPENIIWGYVAYKRLQDAPIAESVLDSLEQRGAAPVTLIPGDFGYFTLTPDGKITLIDKSSSEYQLNFVYGMIINEQAIRAVIRHFYVNNYDQVFIFIRTSKGQVFTSNIG